MQCAKFAWDQELYAYQSGMLIYRMVIERFYCTMNPLFIIDLAFKDLYLSNNELSEPPLILSRRAHGYPTGSSALNKPPGQRKLEPRLLTKVERRSDAS
jgi:hypothetical protein